MDISQEFTPYKPRLLTSIRHLRIGQSLVYCKHTVYSSPASASDVAGAALAILTATNTKFAIRGGGHMPVPEAAGIADGVLISAEKLNIMQLTKSNNIALLGPGLKTGGCL